MSPALAFIPVAKSVAKEGWAASYFYEVALPLTDAERQTLRGLQRQHRDGPGYVKVTVILLLGKGRSVPHIADDLGLDPATVYRYAAAYQTQSLGAYLGPETETGGYWGLLTSPQLGRLCRELDAHVYTDCRLIRTLGVS